MVVKMLGQRLREIRVARDLTQSELGDLLNFHPTAIAHIEAGRRNVNVDRLVSMCKSLQVSSDYLLGLSDKPK